MKKEAPLQVFSKEQSNECPACPQWSNKELQL